MPAPPRVTALGARVVALILALASPAVCAAQAPNAPAAASFERIRQELNTPPAPRLKLDVPVAVATFRVEVKQRQYILPFMEQFNKEFALNASQRQSQDWASRCCGINLIDLTTGLATRLNKALKAREARKTREQIARELAELQAAARRAAADTSR